MKGKGALAASLVLVAGAGWLVAAWWPRAVPAPATFVGRQVCAGCHPRQDAAWRGSDHDLAMQPADRTTVLGDFGGAPVSQRGVTSTFFWRDDKPIVRTEGPTGWPEEFEIAYTFGVRPLQQYLVALSGGRYQTLTLAWDTRARTAGGQRWLDLYASERPRPGDPLHWTGRDQTWNHMCAECHSTNLRKNYRLADGRYETTWSELNVACEACHGPGSHHVAWARSGGKTRRAGDRALGLDVRLADHRDAAWSMDEATGVARRTGPAPSRLEVETCARCHARRGVIDDNYVHGRPLLDTHRPALLEPELYHADGQILGEVYEYGSFLQSRMFRAGVTCSDCHDPHSLETAELPSAVCARCHLPARFDTPVHHHHRAGSPGSACVGCHMPERTYMLVDGRRDHSLRVPRPDLSVAIGTPNACTGCHADRTASWAAEVVARWVGGRPRPAHYGQVLDAGRRDLPNAGVQLVSLMDDVAAPAIVRATAVSLLRFRSVAAIRALERAVTDPEPLVRLAAAGAADSLGLDSRLSLLLRLLDDPLRAIRIEAARALADAPAERLAPEQRAALDRGLADYRRAQAINADRAEAHLSLGLLADRRRDPNTARQEYERALALDPTFVPAYVNLADHYRERDQDQRGEQLLRQGIVRVPGAAALHHALGLVLVRRGRTAEALVALGRAAELAPGSARYAYVHAVALSSTGAGDRALDILGRAHERHPGDPDILVALTTLSRDRGDRQAARDYARKLLQAVPELPEARQLARELEGR
ncbi:MAG TPA: HEAT repeat domain-containing protein [Methylomirabilota bacterium]|nr:HEAT repeat domain-containing protein [Methylomirabilota bacterium]